jgi:hypothetical protein
MAVVAVADSMAVAVAVAGTDNRSAMPDANVCALCLNPIPPGAGYVVRIDVFADPHLPPMTTEQIAAADLNGTLAELMLQMEKMTADELQDGVHRRLEYRLCAACHKSYLANPLGMPRKVHVSSN